MNVIATPKGNLKWRNPTVIENMKLLKNSKGFFKDQDYLGAKISIMESLEFLLDYSELEGIENFDQLNACGDEMLTPMSQIADEIMTKLSDALQKKQ